MKADKSLRPFLSLLIKTKLIRAFRGKKNKTIILTQNSSTDLFFSTVVGPLYYNQFLKLEINTFVRIFKKRFPPLIFLFNFILYHASYFVSTFPVWYGYLHFLFYSI